MDVPLKVMDRRRFLGSAAALSAVPALAGTGASAASSESQPPESLVQVMSLLAPQGLSMKPGPGFAMKQNGEVLPWALDSLEEPTADLWQFRYRSQEGLEASGSLRLDRDHRVSEYRVKLTNTSDRRSRPLTRLFSLFLRLGEVSKPRIMSCSGASSASYFPHAREYPSGCLSSPLDRAVSLPSGGVCQSPGVDRVPDGVMRGCRPRQTKGIRRTLDGIFLPGSSLVHGESRF